MSLSHTKRELFSQQCVPTGALAREPKSYGEVLHSPTGACDDVTPLDDKETHAWRSPVRWIRPRFSQALPRNETKREKRDEMLSLLR